MPSALSRSRARHSQMVSSPLNNGPIVPRLARTLVLVSVTLLAFSCLHNVRAQQSLLLAETTAPNLGQVLFEVGSSYAHKNDFRWSLRALRGAKRFFGTRPYADVLAKVERDAQKHAARPRGRTVAVPGYGSSDGDNSAELNGVEGVYTAAYRFLQRQRAKQANTSIDDITILHNDPEFHQVFDYLLEAERGRPAAVEDNAGPWMMPDDTIERFTMGHTIKVSFYYQDMSGESAVDTFDYNAITALISEASLGGCGHYGYTDVSLRMLITYANVVKGKRVVVFGSRTPWYESILLSNGAKHVTTVDYIAPKFEHPDITTITVAEAEAEAKLAAEGRGGGGGGGVHEGFDVGVSMSSFEHSGLGRYGDDIDPDGDIEAMHVAARLIKPDGSLFLAVPFGKDHVQWNLHRVYGKLRLPYLLKGWTIEKVAGMSGVTDNGRGDQPVMWLKNTPGSGDGWDGRPWLT